MEDGASIVGTIIGIIVWLGVFAGLILITIGFWKFFVKAGHPGWVALVPFYREYIIVTMAGKEPWYVLLLLCTGVLGNILVGMDMAERWGKDRTWGLIFFGLLWPVGYVLLGFSEDAKYTAPPSA